MKRMVFTKSLFASILVLGTVASISAKIEKDAASQQTLISKSLQTIKKERAKESGDGRIVCVYTAGDHKLVTKKYPNGYRKPTVIVSTQDVQVSLDRHDEKEVETVKVVHDGRNDQEAHITYYDRNNERLHSETINVSAAAA